MKKIDFKFSKRQAILFTALIALTAFGVWSSGVLSSSAPEASVDSLKHVTEHIASEDINVKPKVSENIVSTTQNIPEEPARTEQIVPEATVSEDTNASPTYIQKFESYYPTYASANKELFASNVATIVGIVGENKIDKFIDDHAQATGIKGLSEPNFEAEKNSFFRLIIHRSYHFELSWQPWSTL